jgi:hypothetical protein
MKKKRMMICNLTTVILQQGMMKMKMQEEVKMKRHQMSPLMMIFVGPSLMHTEMQKQKTRSES